MVLIAHQAQGPRPVFYLSSKPWLTGLKLRSSIHFQLAGATERVSSSHGSYLRRSFITPREKNLKVSRFRGSPSNDGSYGRESSSNNSKTSLQLPGTKGDREEASEALNIQNHVSCESAEIEDSETRSLAVKNLFMKWLIILRTQTSTQSVDKLLKKSSDRWETSEDQSLTEKKRPVHILKSVVGFFLGLDAAVTLPLMIFIPWYLGVKVAYGAEVTKELTPLWVLGPVFLAIYVKLVQALYALYMFCFKQTARFIKNLPALVLLACNYIAEGKLKEYLWLRFWKPILEMKNMDYKNLVWQKYKQVEEWVVDKYLDYVESIWPFYCRTIRFLKKANLI